MSLFVIYPFLSEGNLLGFRIIDFFFLAMLLSAVYAVSDRRRIFYLTLAVLACAFVSRVINALVDSTPMILATVGFHAILFTLTAIVILADVLKDERVTSNKIFGALCVYLMIGLIWTLVFILLETCEPGSFNGLRNAEEASLKSLPQLESGTFSYYSFVTLTTLGYGDITPVSRVARSFATLEAVMGQLYLAVLVARLVGLHIVHAGEQKRETLK
jgi:hypothetical protein